MIREITTINTLTTPFDFFSAAHELYATYKIFDDKNGSALRRLAGMDDPLPNSAADEALGISVNNYIVVSKEAYSQYSDGFWLFAQLATWHDLRNTEHHESYLLETLHYKTLKWLHNFENLLILQELSRFELLSPFKEELNNLNSEIKEFTQNYRALLLEQYSYFHLHYQILEYLLKIEKLNKQLQKIEGEKETSLCRHLSNTISPLIKILKEMISSDNHCQPVGLMHLSTQDRSYIKYLPDRIKEIRITINNLQHFKLFYDDPKLMEQFITTYNELASQTGSLKGSSKPGFFSDEITTVRPLLKIYQPQPHSEAIEKEKQQFIHYLSQGSYKSDLANFGWKDVDYTDLHLPYLFDLLLSETVVKKGKQCQHKLNSVDYDQLLNLITIEAKETIHHMCTRHNLFKDLFMDFALLSGNYKIVRSLFPILEPVDPTSLLIKFYSIIAQHIKKYDSASDNLYDLRLKKLYILNHKKQYQKIYAFLIAQGADLSLVDKTVVIVNSPNGTINFTIEALQDMESDVLSLLNNQVDLASPSLSCQP